MKRKFFLIPLLALMLTGLGCDRKAPFEPVVSITLKVQYGRLNSINVQGDDVVVWFTCFVGSAQYGWYSQRLINSGDRDKYETTIDNACAGRWLFYIRDVNIEVAQRIFLNGVELTEIADGKAKATISKTGSVSSGWL